MSRMSIIERVAAEIEAGITSGGIDHNRLIEILCRGYEDLQQHPASLLAQYLAGADDGPPNGGKKGD